MSWQDAGLAIAAKSEAAFSLLFYSSAADGYGLTFAAYPSVGSTPTACEIVAGQGSTFKDTPYWLLDIDLSSFEEGTYSVQPNLELADFGGRAAMVSLKSAIGQKEVFRHAAYRGELELVTQAGTFDELKQSHPSVTGFVEFPIVGVQTLACMVAGDVNGNFSATCDCEREDGVKFTCDDTSGKSCCVDPNAETVRVPIGIEAAPLCLNLCAVTASLRDRCAELR